MRFQRALWSLALVAGFAVPTFAEVENYAIDTGHSQVGFKVRHLVSKVPGRFDKFTGTIAVDPADLTTAKITAAIEAASISTNHADRDNHLRSADFLDAAKFPELKFESVRYIPEGAKGGRLLGNLTIRGITKAVELKVEVLGFGADPWGGQRGGFSASTTINRKDFGMVWNKALDAGGVVLGDDVEIQIDLETVRQKPAAAKG
jgi:polyisoprenoid-binding protein YceI